MTILAQYTGLAISKLEEWKDSASSCIEEIATALAVDNQDKPIHISGVIRCCIASPLISFVGGGVAAWITGQGIVAAGTLAAGVALAAVAIHTLAVLLLQQIGDDYNQKIHPYTYAALCSCSLASSALLWHVPFSWVAGIPLLLPFLTAQRQKQDDIPLRHMPLLVWFA